MATYELGVRRFRDELRRWLEAIQAGDEVVVTERGRPVARVVAATAPSGLDRLIAEGVITPPSRPRDPAGDKPRIVPLGPVSELVLEQRR